MSLAKDRRRRLLSALQELGKKVDLSSLGSRVVFQKTVYFLQEFGIELGYDFGWYVLGPYSTSLARDAFEIDTIQQALVSIKGFLDPSHEVSKTMKGFFKDLDEISSETKPKEYWYELLSSLHFLHNKATPKAESKHEAMVRLSTLKPDKFDPKDTETAWGLLSKYELVSAS